MNKTDQKIERMDLPRQDVWQMFNRISQRYDFLNRFLSMRRDVAWRKKLVALLPAGDGLKLLDIACGTADVLLTLQSGSEKFDYAAGVDLAKQMLEIGQRKTSLLGLTEKSVLFPADAMRLPFKAGAFDVVTIAFGIRNVINVDEALSEIYRVLVPGGRLLVLEFSLPKNRLLRAAYLFYFRKILPVIGGIISGDSKAYSYLNKTVESFPYGEKFCRILKKTGFVNTKTTPVTFGIASIYSTDKK